MLGEVGCVHVVPLGDCFRGSAANSVAGEEIHVVPRCNMFSALSARGFTLYSGTAAAAGGSGSALGGGVATGGAALGG